MWYYRELPRQLLTHEHRSWETMVCLQDHSILNTRCVKQYLEFKVEKLWIQALALIRDWGWVMTGVVVWEWKGRTFQFLVSSWLFADFPVATVRRETGKLFETIFRCVPLFSALTPYLGVTLAFNSGFILMFLCFPDNWWSQVCPRYFLRLVDLYKGAVVYLLSGRKTLLIPVLFSSYITAALRLLEKLHKVRGKRGRVLAQDDSVFSALCQLAGTRWSWPWLVSCVIVHQDTTWGRC